MTREEMDNVNHPKHYADNCSLECIEAMEIAYGRQAVIDFCKCNAFKYLWRFENKNGKEDLRKANWYCNYGSGLYINYDDIGKINDEDFENLRHIIARKIDGVE